jgi:hypothetical protein
MSAAATAAGYLYASGRLRGRGSKEDPRKEEHAPERRKIRVAALPEQQAEPVPAPAPAPKRAPTIQYRTKRWRPDAG